MIELSNTTAQTLDPGQSITFDNVILHTGNGECHRPGSSAVKMRCHGIYAVALSGNITSNVAGAVQLSIEVGGEVLPETTMISTPAAVGDINNVATQTRVKNCCCDYDKITVTNTGTTDVVVEPNASLIVERRA